MAQRTRGKNFPKELIEKLKSYEIKGTGKEYLAKIAAASKDTGLTENQVVVSLILEYSLYVHAYMHCWGQCIASTSHLSTAQDWVKRRQKVEKMEREQELELLVDGTLGALERQAQRAPISMVGHRPAE